MPRYPKKLLKRHQEKLDLKNKVFLVEEALDGFGERCKCYDCTSYRRESYEKKQKISKISQKALSRKNST